MFIERSASRIRLMRTVFVLLGLLPCLTLGGWAALRHSRLHREALERRAEQVLGLSLACGGVEHVRPDALRLRSCRLSSPTGGLVLEAPLIDVETSADEVRVSIARVDCTPALARGLLGLAADWLGQPGRFPRNCVVDVAEFHWSGHPSPPGAASGLRLECVAANGARAIRARRGGAGDAPADEVRLRRVPENAVPADAPAPPGAPRFELEAHLSEPVPVAVVEALLGVETGGLPLGAEAGISGDVTLAVEDDRFSGTAAVRLERIDLAVFSRHMPHRLSGEATVSCPNLVLAKGRIASCDARVDMSRGRVAQRLLDAAVSVLGCRPGPAFRSLTGEETRAFDDLALSIKVVRSGIELRADPARAGGLARVQGLALLEEPRSAVPLDRLAWFLAPPGAVALPASRATAWLLERLSWEAAPAGGAALAPADQAVRPTGRSEF
ncbi:MAG: hypothetical protein RLZZ111_545 [Planctomycetota bacterium]|jgi:hypothetical protein